MDEDIRNREFLGRGLAFPLQFNPRGEIALANGERDIEQAIHLILSTVPGERPMRPGFGGSRPVAGTQRASTGQSAERSASTSS